MKGIKKKHMYRKKNIPKAVRERLWSKYLGKI